MDAQEDLEKINSLYRLLHSIYHGIALKNGLSDSAFFVMYAMIELGEGCMQKDIAKLYKFSRQTINTSVIQLRKKGYITCDKEHSKILPLYLTLLGKEMASKIISPIKELEITFVKNINVEERKQFFYLAEKYIKELDEVALKMRTNT